MKITATLVRKELLSQIHDYERPMREIGTDHEDMKVYMTKTSALIDFGYIMGIFSNDDAKKLWDELEYLYGNLRYKKHLNH